MTIIETLKDLAAGIDGYNLKIMKAILESIILPISITHIINLSFLRGIVPKELKTARVMPLFNLLFLLFKVSKNLFPIMYADDTSLFVGGVDVNELINTGNSELKQICQWLNANKLSLNVKKSKYILFSKSKSLPDPINP